MTVRDKYLEFDMEFNEVNMQETGKEECISKESELVPSTSTESVTSKSTNLRSKEKESALNVLSDVVNDSNKCALHLPVAQNKEEYHQEPQSKEEHYEHNNVLKRENIDESVLTKINESNINCKDYDNICNTDIKSKNRFAIENINSNIIDSKGANKLTIIPEFPHSPSCNDNALQRVAKPPHSRLPYKTPMSSKSTTPLSSLLPSPSSSSTITTTAAINDNVKAVMTATATSPLAKTKEKVSNVIAVDVTSLSSSSSLSSTPPLSALLHLAVNHKVNSINITTINNKFCKNKESDGKNSSSLCVNSDVLNTKEDNNNNDNNNNRERNGKMKESEIVDCSTSCATYSDNSHLTFVKTTCEFITSENSLLRKQFYKESNGNNTTIDNGALNFSINTHSQSSSFTSTSSPATLFKESPLSSPSSFVEQQQEQEKERNHIIPTFISKHQKKMQKWSSLLFKAITQQEEENKNSVSKEYVLELCTRIAHAIPGDAQSAKDTLLMLLVHLRDPENGNLRQRLISGELPVDVLINMDEHDLVNPRRRRKLDEEYEERAKDRNLTEIKKATQTTSRLFACPTCKERDCTWYQKQTRSGDEPMTIFCTCNKCGNTWKRY